MTFIFNIGDKVTAKSGQRGIVKYQFIYKFDNIKSYQYIVEFENGNQFSVEEAALERDKSPKFKVGDKIRSKSNSSLIYEIVECNETTYIIRECNLKWMTISEMEKLYVKI